LHSIINQSMKAMKKFIILLIIPLFTILYANAQTQTGPASATQSKTEANPNAPVAKWDATMKDLGEIPQGVPKNIDFTLTNNGKEPLLIKSASATCGCTIAKYSQEPILPGKSTVITATFNAQASGPFNKSVTVITNADPNPVSLQFKGTVK
jgi:hypothetical protein